MREFSTQSTGYGIAVGKAVVIERNSHSSGTRMKFEDAYDAVSQELGLLAESNEIFAAHLEILEDPMLKESVEEARDIAGEKTDESDNDAKACQIACENICAMFAEIDDEYLKSRTDDIRDIFNRIIAKIKGEISVNPFENLEENSIIIAEELNPSDTAMMDFSKISGMICSRGSSTSHVCIIAKSKGIPALTGVEGCLEISNGATLIIDADKGIAIEMPDTETLSTYTQLIENEKSRLQSIGNIKVSNKFGNSVKVKANAGSIDDVRRAIENGADGIGLFRSEFVFMESKNGFPGEEEQFAIYREAAQICGDKNLCIRTLDIGADKSLPYYQMPAEENPFLGVRAIRFSMSKPEIFKEQLKAILRASAYGDVSLMFPMITSSEEFNEAKMLLEECKNELRLSNTPFDESIKTGLMIETPAAVFISEELAKEADFFSIGTNDLTQYVMASDRGNVNCSKYYDPMSPAVLKAIKITIEAARKAGIESCMCGEMASDTNATEILYEYGLESFSVAAPLVGKIRYELQNISSAAVAD